MTSLTKQRAYSIVCPEEKVEDFKKLCEELVNSNFVKFAIGKPEISKDGFEHDQIYLSTTNPVRLSNVLAKLKHLITTIEVGKDSYKLLEYIGKSSTTRPDGVIWEIGNISSFTKSKVYGAKMSNNDLHRLALESGSFEAGVLLWQTRKPFDYAKNKSSIDQALRYEYPEMMKIYPAESFNRPLEKFEPPRRMTKLFVGPSGIGKTQFAKAHFKYPLYITHNEDYKKWSKLTDGVIIDDIKKSSCGAETMIRELNAEENQTKNVKYGSAEIKKGIRRIYILNDITSFFPSEYFIKDPTGSGGISVDNIRPNCMEKFIATMDRLDVVPLKECLYKRNALDVIMNKVRFKEQMKILSELAPKREVEGGDDYCSNKKFKGSRSNNFIK